MKEAIIIYKILNEKKKKRKRFIARIKFKIFSQKIQSQILCWQHKEMAQLTEKRLNSIAKGWFYVQNLYRVGKLPIIIDIAVDFEN